MIYTTLERIRAHSPCADGWIKLLDHLGKTKADDEPLPMTAILDSNGIDDALWCLRAEPQHSAIWRLLAVHYARQVQHLMTDPRSINALDVAERHAHGLATDGDLRAAREAAWDARSAACGAAWDARSAAWAAARGAAWAAARDAAWAAARDAARDATRDETRKKQAADLRTVLEHYDAAPGTDELSKCDKENAALKKAITKLHKAKGRYHTQIAVCDLFDLVGLPNERPKK